jgi:hypothetical protein
MVLVAFLWLLPVVRAQASRDSTAAAGSASASDTQCLPTETSLTTVKDHFKRLACGFEQPLDIIQTFGAPAATAGFSQLLTSHEGFSSDAGGYGRHYGVNLLGGVSSKVLGQFLLPTAFHQDDRYKHTKAGTPAWGRIGNILKHVIVTQSAGGSNEVFNVSALPNSLLSAALSNTYQPKPQRTAAASAQRFGWNLFGFSAGDAFAEFRPDLIALGGEVTKGIAKLWPWHK